MTWSLFHGGYARADIDDDAGALMAEDRRKQPLGVGARQGEFVGVADAGRLDLDQHLAGARAVELDGGHFERLAGAEGDGGANIHGLLACFAKAWLGD
jgi:hypothetical protein